MNAWIIRDTEGVDDLENLHHLVRGLCEIDHRSAGNQDGFGRLPEYSAPSPDSQGAKNAFAWSGATARPSPLSQTLQGCSPRQMAVYSPIKPTTNIHAGFSGAIVKTVFSCGF